MTVAIRPKAKPSKPAVGPGRWRMRHGHVALVEARLDIHSTGPAGEKKIYPHWQGKCLDCGTKLTWMPDGSYSAIQRHAYDLVAPL